MRPRRSQAGSPLHLVLGPSAPLTPTLSRQGRGRSRDTLLFLFPSPLTGEGEGEGGSEERLAGVPDTEDILNGYAACKENSASSADVMPSWIIDWIGNERSVCSTSGRRQRVFG